MIKKIMVILTILLMVSGCNVSNDGETVLKEYTSNFNQENRNHIKIHYDYDGIFDDNTAHDLIELSLEEEKMEADDIKLENYDIDEINNKVNQYKLDIIDNIGFIFNDAYEVTEENIDENNIRIILKNDNMKINVYQGGYIKLIKDNKTICYKSENNNFDSGISSFYKTIKSMNDYTLEIIKEMNKKA